MPNSMVISKELSYLAELSVGMFDDSSYSTSNFPNSISIKGNRFALKTPEGREFLDNPIKLHFVTLGVKAPKSRQWYAGAYDDNNASPPSCSSYDSVTPDTAGPVVPSRTSGRQSDTCNTCEVGRWGSATSIKGAMIPACRSHKDIVIKVMGIEGAWLLQIPPASIRLQWEPLIDRIKKTAESERIKHGKSTLTQLTCVVEATFDEKTQGVLNFRPLGYLAESEIPAVITLSRDKDAIINMLWGPEGSARMDKWRIPAPSVERAMTSQEPRIKEEVVLDVVHSNVVTKKKSERVEPIRTSKVEAKPPTTNDEVEDILKSMGIFDG